MQFKGSIGQGQEKIGVGLVGGVIVEEDPSASMYCVMYVLCVCVQCMCSIICVHTCTWV